MTTSNSSESTDKVNFRSYITRYNKINVCNIVKKSQNLLYKIYIGILQNALQTDDPENYLLIDHCLQGIIRNFQLYNLNLCFPKRFLTDRRTIRRLGRQTEGRRDEHFEFQICFATLNQIFKNIFIAFLNFDCVRQSVFRNNNITERFNIKFEYVMIYTFLKDYRNSKV